MFEMLEGKQIKEVHRATYDETKKSMYELPRRSAVEFGDSDPKGGEVAIVFSDGSYLLIRGSEWGTIFYIKA